MAKIDEQSSGKKEGEIRYLTPLISTRIPKRNIADSKGLELSISTTKTQIFY